MNLSKRIYYKILSYLKISPYKILRFYDNITNIFFEQNHPPQSLIDKLEEIGCGSTCHMNRNLLDHFQRTYQLLKKWGNSDSICLAGLYSCDLWNRNISYSLNSF